MHRTLLLGTGLLFLLVGLAWGTRPGQVAVKTVLFVTQVIPAFPVKPQELLFPEPVVEEVSFPLPDGRTGVGDLYRPSRPGRYGAILFFLGVNPAGRDDPRVVNLGKALARSGVVALVPWSKAMVELRVDPREVDLLVGAFQFLRSLPFVDPQRVGIGGFCVGASFALVAAADPRIRDQVAFVNDFGGYYDVRDLVIQVASRTRFQDGQALPWSPEAWVQDVLTTNLIGSLPDPRERQALHRFFAEGDTSALEGLTLSPAGEAVRRLLEGVSLEEARRLVQALPPAFQRLAKAVSPRETIRQVRALVLVMHDAQDPLVPAEESRRLVEALQENGKAYSYTEFRLFRHMDPTRPLALPAFLAEVGKLFRHLYRILSVSA